MGLRLNREFYTLAGACGLVDKGGPENISKVDFLPPSLRDDPRLPDVSVAQDWHPAFLFLYPFVDAEVTSMGRALSTGSDARDLGSVLIFWVWVVRVPVPVPVHEFRELGEAWADRAA